MYMEASR
jgi:hypothetical protein